MAYKDTIISDLHNTTSLSSHIAEFQKEAKQSFDTLGIPTVKNEEWKFTNLAKVFNKDFQLQKCNLEASYPELSGFEQHEIIFQNGFLTKSPSIDTKEIEICDLATKLQDEAFAKNVFNQAFAGNQDTLVDLNTAFLQGGIYIKIKKGQTVSLPIVIKHFLDGNDVNTANYSRLIVEIEENAEATIISSNKSLGSFSTLSNFAAEINIGKGARLKYYTLQNDNTEASQINNIKVIQKSNSVLDAVTISLDGDLIRNNLNVILDAEHIESNFSSLYLIKGKTHVDNHTVADHKYPNCNSNELYKGIMDERARGVFNGKIFVRKDAQKTNAFQANNNILLSDDAIINTKPQLEIWADDVKCSHGCTVGQLDKEALFYLQSRGIGEHKAKSLLLESFAAEVAEKITFEPFAEYVTGLISKRFGNI